MQDLTDSVISDPGDLMRGSSHIRTVLIGEEYRNFRRALDVYLCFWIGQIQSKLLNRLVTNGLGESTFTYLSKI